MATGAHDYSEVKLARLRVVGYFFALLLTFTVVDFFKVKDSAEGSSYDHFNRYFANAYPDCMSGDLECLFSWSNGSNEPDKQEVSVVLWTDSVLEKEGMSWPLDWEEHAYILGEFLKHGPKAVVVDLFFIDDPEERGGDTAFAEVICDYEEEQEARLYLVKPPGIPNTMNDSLNSSIKGMCGLDLKGEGAGEFVKLVDASLSDDVPSRAYPNECQKSLAVEVYRDEVDRDMIENTRCGDGDFHMFWGIGERNYHTGIECDEKDDYFPDHIGGVLWKIVSDILQVEKGNNSLCPYIRTILASGSEHDEENFRRYVEDKFVFYGADIHGAGDIYELPIQNGHRLPGVYMHAMALDNLLATRGKVHPVKKGVITKFFYYLISACLATGIFVLVRHGFFKLSECVLDRVPSLAVKIVLEFSLWMGLVIVIGSAMILIAWIVYLLSFSFGYFGFVLNWIGIIVVSGILSIWVKLPMAENIAKLLSCRGSGHKPDEKGQKD